MLVFAFLSSLPFILKCKYLGFYKYINHHIYLLNPKTIEMEKREKVHHHLANVLLVPRITQRRRRTHRRTRETRARTTAALMARTRESERARKTRESHGTPPTTHEDGAHGLCDGAVASWCGGHGERVVDDLGAFLLVYFCGVQTYNALVLNVVLAFFSHSCYTLTRTRRA